MSGRVRGRGVPPAFIHPEIIRLGLSKSVIRVYLQLVFRGGENGWAKCSAKRLKDEIGDVGLRQVGEALRELTEEGLIHRDQRPENSGGSGSYIYVLGVDQWLAKRVEKDETRVNPGGSLGTDPSEPIGIAESTPGDHSLLQKDKSPSNKSRSSSSGSKKRDGFRPTDPVPNEWLTPEFLEAWGAYVEARWERWKGKVAWTDRAAKIACGKLVRGRTLAAAIDHLNDASVAGWQNLFAEKNASRGADPEYQSKTLGREEDLSIPEL